jgi:hypothetical protein
MSGTDYYHIKLFGERPHGFYSSNPTNGFIQELSWMVFAKIKGDPEVALRRKFCWSGLKSLHVLRLPAFGAFYDIKLDLLTFLQAAEAIRLDGGEVYKYVLPILTADKAIALGIVKPLHCSCFHCVAISFFLILR